MPQMSFQTVSHLHNFARFARVLCSQAHGVVGAAVPHAVSQQCVSVHDHGVKHDTACQAPAMVATCSWRLMHPGHVSEAEVPSVAQTLLPTGPSLLRGPTVFGLNANSIANTAKATAAAASLSVRQPRSLSTRNGLTAWSVAHPAALLHAASGILQGDDVAPTPAFFSSIAAGAALPEAVSQQASCERAFVHDSAVKHAITSEGPTVAQSLLPAATSLLRGPTVFGLKANSIANTIKATATAASLFVRQPRCRSIPNGVTVWSITTGTSKGAAAASKSALFSSAAAGSSRFLLDQFKELVANTKQADVRGWLEHYQEVLLMNGVVSENALRGLTDEQLRSFDLLPGAIAAIKEAYPSRTAAGGTDVPTEDMALGILLQRYASSLRPLQPESSHRGPVPVKPDGTVSNVGKHFLLAGYDDSVDEILKVLLKMERDWDVYDSNRFESSAQVIRVVAAPGSGKTTLATNIWARLQGRLQQVKQTHASLWSVWAQNGAEELLQRLESSWTTTRGPLVFMVSHNAPGGLDVLLEREREVVPMRQAAARMLWSAVCNPVKTRYSKFLDDLGSLLHALTPELVQNFVCKAAGLSDQRASLLVWIWDEMNAVKIQPGSDTTFSQDHLSQMVQARRSFQSEHQEGGPNVMLVLMAVTTQGSATSLAMTTSRKSKIADLQPPRPMQLQASQVLIFMDLMRRLSSQPPQLAEQLQQLGITQDTDISMMSDEQRSKLVELCPRHVAKALWWTGGNMRSAEVVLGALSRSRQDNKAIQVGDMHWWHPDRAPTINLIVQELVEEMLPSGWAAWMSPGTQKLQQHIMQWAMAASMCSKLVTRDEAILKQADALLYGLEGRTPVTVEMLERDGMLQLYQVTNSAAGDTRIELVGNGNSNGTPVHVQLPPALLFAYLRRTNTLRSRLLIADAAMDTYSFREHDDIAVLGLQLQLRREYYREVAVRLGELCPSLAGSRLGAQYVAVPKGRYEILKWGGDVPAGLQQTFIEDAAQPDSPFMYLFGKQSAGPDSMMVLHKSDEQGNRTGGVVLLYLQSKTTNQQKPTFGREDILTEVMKVQGIGPDTGDQVLMIVADHLPPAAYQRASSANNSPDGAGGIQQVQGLASTPTSDSAPPDGSSYTISEQQMQVLAEGGLVKIGGRYVSVLYRGDAWKLRRGVMRLYEGLTDKVVPVQRKPKDKYDSPLLAAIPSGRRGKPKLVDALESDRRWRRWAHVKEEAAPRVVQLMQQESKLRALCVSKGLEPGDWKPLHMAERIAEWEILEKANPSDAAHRMKQLLKFSKAELLRTCTALEPEQMRQMTRKGQVRLNKMDLAQIIIKHDTAKAEPQA